MVKLVALVRRRPGMTPEGFADYWLRIHAPLAARIPGMLGYRINLAGDPGSLSAAPYDGSAEIWFASREAMEAGLASPEGAVAGEDVSNFAEPIAFLVTDEHVVIA
jgi:uncharacterized protein (TIGR02118 family)